MTNKCDFCDNISTETELAFNDKMQFKTLYLCSECYKRTSEFTRNKLKEFGLKCIPERVKPADINSLSPSDWKKGNYHMDDEEITVVTRELQNGLAEQFGYKPSDVHMNIVFACTVYGNNDFYRINTADIIACNRSLCRKEYFAARKIIGQPRKSKPKNITNLDFYSKNIKNS